ncbi:MAG: biotin--[acetyl-CoA-carboxylase] ligase [Sphingomonas bacterium]|nr:biotin--[acetyl-CoA-carboxylase] ligase [Sphingomonas bacterium]
MSRIQIVEQTGSTNADLISDSTAGEGDWQIALRQSSGKGRQGRLWQSLDGNFAGSTLIRLRDGDPPPATLALAAGLALIEAADTAAPGRALQLKWPNDLMLANDLQEWAKLGGILLERSGDRVVAGFGVNLAAAPAIEGRATASLDAAVTPQAFAPLLAASFARLLVAWRSADPAVFITAWQHRAHPVGTPIDVHNAPGDLRSGRFDGLDPDGALRLALDGGAVERIHAGDVTLANLPSAR